MYESPIATNARSPDVIVSWAVASVAIACGVLANVTASRITTTTVSMLGLAVMRNTRRESATSAMSSVAVGTVPVSRSTTGTSTSPPTAASIGTRRRVRDVRESTLITSSPKSPIGIGASKIPPAAMAIPSAASWSRPYTPMPSATAHVVARQAASHQRALEPEPGVHRAGAEERGSQTGERHDGRDERVRGPAPVPVGHGDDAAHDRHHDRHERERASLGAGRLRDRQLAVDGEGRDAEQCRGDPEREGIRAGAGEERHPGDQHREPHRDHFDPTRGDPGEMAVEKGVDPDHRVLTSERAVPERSGSRDSPCRAPVDRGSSNPQRLCAGLQRLPRRPPHRSRRVVVLDRRVRPQSGRRRRGVRRGRRDHRSPRQPHGRARASRVATAEAPGQRVPHGRARVPHQRRRARRVPRAWRTTSTVRATRSAASGSPPGSPRSTNPSATVTGPEPTSTSMIGSTTSSPASSERRRGAVVTDSLGT